MFNARALPRNNCGAIAKVVDRFDIASVAERHVVEKSTAVGILRLFNRSIR